jgi:Selenoprotein SelK_SelG
MAHERESMRVRDMCISKLYGTQEQCASCRPNHGLLICVCARLSGFLYLFLGRIVRKRTIWRLSIIPEMFWAIVNFFYVL